MRRTLQRRRFLQNASAGTVIAALGGLYVLLGNESTAYAETRADGRPRVPPGQRLLSELKDMGGREGDPKKSKWSMRVHGEVDTPFEIDFRGLTKMEQHTVEADVHCVTGWSVIGHTWKGVTFRDLAERAGVKDKARYVIFEADGYTANIPLREAMRSNVMIVHRMNGKGLPRAHGAPVRALVPDLYFWKGPKWLTGIRFSKRDRRGYWEKRGYHNRGNPWKEERFA
jgi:DMSO/TMAO reductase YedYZ molybdopterin-dependent catalytic subunit